MDGVRAGGAAEVVTEAPLEAVPPTGCQLVETGEPPVHWPTAVASPRGDTALIGGDEAHVFPGACRATCKGAAGTHVADTSPLVLPDTGCLQSGASRGVAVL